MTSITIPNSVTSIGDFAFYGCGLTSIIIPSSITIIEDYTFGDCNLTSVIIPNSVTTIGNYAFGNCHFTSITIPNSVTTIGHAAFLICGMLTSITIPSSVTTIGSSVFADCTSLTSIDVESGNSAYASENGVLFDKSKTTLICYPAGKTADTYAIPGSVTTIENNAFSSCWYLTLITIPNSVTSIGNMVFYNCGSLTSIDVESENNIYASENGVLFDKSKITLICYPAGKTADTYVIPNSITIIGNSAFSSCTNLALITVPNSVTTIGDVAFYRCTSLTSITLPNSVITIGGSAFTDCRNLTSITLPNSVTTIGSDAFSYCTSLTSITIPNSVITIGSWAFSRCTSLTLITNLNLVPIELNPYSWIFDGVDQSICTLTVPTSAISAYENAEVWKEFNIVGGGILVNPVSSNNEQGYVEGNGLYEGDGKATATVTAFAYTGYKFANWTKGGIEVSTNNPYSFTVTEDVELVANFEEEVGIENLELSALKIYPNPTKGELKIESGELRVVDVIIYDVFGKIQKIGNWKTENAIDISHLPAGVYFVKICTEVGEMVRKVLKE